MELVGFSSGVSMSVVSEAVGSMLTDGGGSEGLEVEMGS